MIYLSNMIRKNIDLDEQVVRKLKVLAAHDDIDVKHYIQDVIITHVKNVYEWLPKRKK